MDAVLISIIAFVAIGVIFTVVYKFIIPVQGEGGEDGGSDMSHDSIIEKAKMLYEMGQLSKAIATLEKYVGKVSNDLKARDILGTYLVEKKVFDKAEKHFSHIAKFDPDFPKVNENLGDCYYNMAKNDKAIEAYNKVLAAAPNNHEIRYKLADILALKGDSDGAIKEIRKILSQNVYDVKGRRMLSDLFFAREEFKRAIFELEEITKIEPNNLEVLKRIAAICLKIGELAHAINVYKRIVKIDDADQNAYLTMAKIYLDLKDYNSAADIYNSLISKGYTVSPETMCDLANIHYSTENYDKAISMCKLLLEETPALEKAGLIIGRCYKKLKKYDEAIFAFKNMIKELPDKEEKFRHEISDAVCAWGAQYIEEKNYQQALDKLFEAAEYNSKNPDVYYNLGRANYAVKNFDSALNHFNKAMELSTEPKILIDIGHVYQDIGDTSRAINFYYDAFKTAPNNFSVLYILGGALCNAGFYEKAVEEYSGYIERDPNNSEAYYQLGFVYELMGNKSEAKTYYLKTISMNPQHANAQANLNAIQEKEKNHSQQTDSN